MKMSKSRFNLGDIFEIEDGYYLYLKLNSFGEPEKHSDYPYRLESLSGLGFWNAYRTQEEAEEALEKLVDNEGMKHYSDWKLVLQRPVVEVSRENL